MGVVFYMFNTCPRGGDAKSLNIFSRFTYVRGIGTEFGSSGTVGVYKAFIGLKGVSVEYLTKLMDISKATDKLKKVPTTEKAIVTVLLRHFVPTIQQVHIDKLMLLRKDVDKKQKTANHSQLLSDNVEMGYGCVDEGDYQIMKKVIAEHKKQLTEAKTDMDNTRRERASMIGFVAPVRANDLSVDWAREWMPPKGLLSKDTVLRWRMKMKYPKSSPPYMFTKSWGDASDVSEHQALRLVLEKAWSWREDLHGQASPYDFSAEQFQRGG